MKFSAFGIFTLLIIFAPKYESFKILKKIKDILHPTTTTLATPVVPDYEREEKPFGTSTATWEVKGQDVWETTTSGKKIHSPFSDKTPHQGTETVSYFSTTTKPTDYNKDSSSGSVSPTNDGSVLPETPGIITIPTIDNIYNNKIQPNYPTTNVDINKHRASSTQPTITGNYYNKLQPDPQRPGSNPAGTQGNPATQPPSSYDRQNLDGSDVDDIVFPDQPSSSRPNTQPVTTSSAASTPTTTKPSGPVPVRDEDTRRVINAPVKECDKGQKLDDTGKCRKITRK